MRRLDVALVRVGSKAAYPKEQPVDGEMNEQTSFMLAGAVYAPNDQCT